MPRNYGVEVQNNFSGGLVTEVTGVNSPENSVVEADNCIFSERGEVSRRQGLAYEPNYQKVPYSSLTLDDGFTREYLWETVSTSGSTEFLVLQTGETITFYQTQENDITSLSQLKKTFSIDLRTYKVVGTPDSVIRKSPVSFTSGFGRLFISHGSCEPISVSYDSVLDDITVQSITVQIRDFEGVDDQLPVDERPSALTSAHEYNIHNQGWHGSQGSPSGTKVDYWDSNRSDFPSNSDVWFLFKDSNDQLSSSLFSRIETGNTKASRGHFLLDAFNQDRSSVSGIAGITTQATDSRPSSIAFFSGRVFYAGVQEDSYSHKIYFSQIIEEEGQYGDCYQSNDPTTEDLSDLLDSDGGVIQIPEINEIIDLRVVGSFLLVFATNGVWSVSGASDGSDFKASDYSINKISTVPTSSKTSIVETEGPIYFWNYDGIYRVQSAEGGGLIVQSLSKTTVQQYYDTIPNASVTVAKGWYNRLDKTITWLYHSQENTSSSNIELGVFNYDKALIFNTLSSAFYPFSFPSYGEIEYPKILGLITVPTYNSSGGSFSYKYIVKLPQTSSVPTALTFCEFNNETYKDFEDELNGFGFNSNFTTGYKIKGQMLKDFQAHYLSVYSKYIYDSSCYVQGIWNYSNSTASSKETTKQQIYRRKDGFDYLKSRLRVRGSGHSLQFKFSSQDGKPFEIIGWATFNSEEGAP